MADDDIDDLLASLDAALEDFDDSTVDDITANNMSTDANTTGDDLDLNLTEFDDDLLASLEADLGTLDPSPPPSPIPSASPTDAKPTSSSMGSTAATSARSSEPVASAASTGTLSTSPDVDAELSQLLGLDEMTMHAPLTPGDSPLSGQSPRYPAPNLSPAPSSSPSPSPSPANSVTTSVASSSAASSVSRSQSRVEYTMDDEEEADDPRLVAARNVLAEYLDVLLQADAGSVKARARRKTMVNENEIRALCHTFLTSDLDVLLSQITSTPSKPLDMSSDTTQGGADDALKHLLLGKEKKSVQDFLTLHTSSKAKSSANAQQHMNLGIIPTRLRARVWTVLLGCHRKDERVMATWDGQLDLENQKVIRMDCDRTRPGQPEFERLGRVERDGAEVRTHVLRDRLERQLTFYCKSRGVGYKQGLNEIVAPFLVLVDTPEQASDDAQEAPTFTLMGDDDDDEDDDEEEQDEDKNRDVPPSTDALPAVVRGWPGEGSVFNMFYSMISKFLPSIFNDREFEYLQCIMRFFNLLLLYHDPGLCHFLDQHHILPELYATPWFITLFSRKLPLRHVFALWDAYIIEDDPFLHYFVALSLLIYNRKRLLRVEAHSLPQTMASLRFGSVATMKKMLLRAKKYRSRTPLSFRQRLFEVSFEIKDVSRIKAISRQVNDQPCMLVPAAELVQQCYHSMLEDGSIKFMILDCRPKAHFANGHLPCAMHLDPELLDKPEEMLERLNGFAAVKGCHFCFLLHDTQEFTSASSAPSPPDAASRVADAGYEPDVAKLFLSHFLQRGFSHLSLCEGGFRACHELVVRAKSELVDHCPDLCEVCTPGCHDQRSGRFSFGSAASRVKSMGSNLLTTLGNVRFRRASGSAEPEPTEPAPAAPAPADTPDEDAPDSGRRGSGIMARFTSLAKKKWPFKKRDQAEEDSASPARRPRSASSPNAVPRKSPSKRAPPAEANALIGTEEWLSDPSVQLFYCKRVIGRSASARGKVLVRVLVVTPVYIIGLEPKDMDPMPSDPPSDFDKAHLVRTGVLKSKNRISDLLKITRKKTMPRLLQFHWRPRSGSTRKSVQIYMVDRCDACIDVVTRHFAAFNSMLLRTTSRARALVTATIPRLARRTLHTKPRTLLGALPTPSAPNPAGLTRLHKLLLAASGLSLGVGASYLRRRNARKAGEDADAEPPRFTLAQVREHSKPDDAWIVIEGEVYDVSGFGPHHPGGAGVLAKYAGRDVTAEFRALKHSRHAEYMRQALRVGYLAEGEEEATKEVEAPAESDVLIVGAGICGLATAYFLSEREKGKRSITVIDEAPLVGGTALKSSAIMFLGPLVEVQEDDKEKKKKKKKTLTSYMCELSYEFLTRVQREWADVRFRDVPMMGLIENEEQLRRAEKMVARMRNGSVELVTDVARLRELEPELSDEAGAVLGAVLHRRAATVDPFLLCDALARRAQANGVRVVLGTRMADVARREGGGFEVHGARGERLGCEKLVLCTGWRVREHAALLGHDVPVAGMHGEMLALAPPTTDFALRHLVYGFEALVHWGKPGVEEKSTREAQPPFARKTNHLYGLQFSEGVLKFGGDRIRTWLDGQVLEDGVAATHAHVAKLFPKLAKAERIGQWSGMLPFTPDQKVVLGRLGEEEGVYAVTGSGVMKGVASGQLLARVVSGDTHGIEDVLAECDPGRFEGKEGEGVE